MVTSFIIAMTSRNDVRPACDQRAAVRFYLSRGPVRDCERELSHMGKNNENPHLVCEK